MIELLFIMLAGIGVGIFTGLMPALPVFTGPFILYYFAGDLPLEHMIVFWLAVVSGSQFFGSVATITTRIPGEESSAIYLNDLNDLSLDAKNKLLYNTALGSFLAGIIGVAIMWIATHNFNPDILPTLMSIDVQFVVYTLAMLSFLFIDKGKKMWAIGLIALGILIGPRNNYALPDIWYQIQFWFQGYTFYMVILGTILLPEILSNRGKHQLDDGNKHKAIRTPFKWLEGIKNSLIGSLSGLIPGPSASLGSTYAYQLSKNDKIVAAETANNASVLTSALPLLLLAMPININTMIMSNLMDIQSVDIQYAILEQSVLLPGFNIIEVALFALTVCLILYYILSTRLIDWYVSVIKSLHSNVLWLLTGIIIMLIGVDLYTAEITYDRYIALLGFFTGIGLILKRYKVNPIVLLFSIILSDKLIWLYIQSYNIYF